MIDTTKNFIYQIEINTIAACLGYFSDKMRKYYEDFSKKFKDQYTHVNLDNIPFHKPQNMDTIADSMIQAIKLFSPEKYSETLIVFVIQDQERNEYDARYIQNILWEK